MVGLRYGFYPRVTDVISRTSEVRASEWYHISHEWIKPYLKNNHEIIYLSHSRPIHLFKNIFSVSLVFYIL